MKTEDEKEALSAQVDAGSDSLRVPVNIDPLPCKEKSADEICSEIEKEAMLEILLERNSKLFGKLS